MSICKGCRAEIEWIRTKTGKMMPVDPEPVFVATGGKQTFVTDEGDIITGSISEEKTDEVAFVPHWATCPAADSFRRRR